MPKLNWTLPNWASVIASTFAGAVVMTLKDDPWTVFSSLPTAEHALEGAALAGLIAVIHLYQDKPSVGGK